MDSIENTYSNGMVKARILTESEADFYRNIPNGFSMDANIIRSVAEKDGKKQIIEITSDGISRINVNI